MSRSARRLVVGDQIEHHAKHGSGWSVLVIVRPVEIGRQPYNEDLEADPPPHTPVLSNPRMSLKGGVGLGCGRRDCSAAEAAAGDGSRAADEKRGQGVGKGDEGWQGTNRADG